MRRDGISTAVTVLGLVLGVGYIAAGLIGWMADATGGDGSDLTAWLILLVGGGALVLAGMYLVRTPAALSITLRAVGAIMGAFAIFWSVIVPIVVLAYIVLMIVQTRRPATAATV